MPFIMGTASLRVFTMVRALRDENLGNFGFKEIIMKQLSVLLVVFIFACSNPTTPEKPDVDDVEFLKEIVLVDSQLSGFQYGSELYSVEFKETSGGITDIVIRKGDETENVSLTSRQPKRFFGLYWMTTWTSSVDGLAGLIVSSDRPDGDHDGPPVPGKIVDPDDAVDPHPHSFYEKAANQSDSGSVKPYDYSYGPRPSPGDQVTITVKLNASSSGTYLFRIALGNNSSIRKVEVPAGNSVHEVKLVVQSSMEPGWHKFRFTTMTDGGDIIYNSKDDYWVKIE